MQVIILLVCLYCCQTFGYVFFSNETCHSVYFLCLTKLSPLFPLPYVCCGVWVEMWVVSKKNIKTVSFSSQPCHFQPFKPAFSLKGPVSPVVNLFFPTPTTCPSILQILLILPMQASKFLTMPLISCMGRHCNV